MSDLNPTCEFCQRLVGFDKTAHTLVIFRGEKRVAEVLVCGHCGELARRLLVLAGVRQ